MNPLPSRVKNPLPLISLILLVLNKGSFENGPQAEAKDRPYLYVFMDKEKYQVSQNCQKKNSLHRLQKHLQ